jgi:hypothetical protein
MDESLKFPARRPPSRPFSRASLLSVRTSSAVEGFVRSVATASEFVGLLRERDVWHPDRPAPVLIRVTAPIELRAIDVSFIHPADLFNPEGRPIILTDARNIDFGPATLVGDWRHTAFARSDLSRARLAGLFHSSGLDGALINHSQYLDLMRQSGRSADA